MRQTGEQLSNGTESHESSFDSLVGLVLPLANPSRSHISKLSAQTSGESFDQLIYKHEAPSLDIILDGHSARIGIDIYYEEHLDPATGKTIGAPVSREIQINFVGQIRSSEGRTIEQRHEIYGKHNLNYEQNSVRLETVLGLYETVARSLSPEEVEAKGFSDEAIQFLSGS